jgi:hypothetical protein
MVTALIGVLVAVAIALVVLLKLALLGGLVGLVALVMLVLLVRREIAPPNGTSGEQSSGPAVRPEGERPPRSGSQAAGGRSGSSSTSRSDRWRSSSLRRK